MGLEIGMFDNGGLKARITQRRTPAIVRGEDAYIVVQVYWAGTDRPYPFAAMSEPPSAYFPPATGTAPVLVLGVGSDRPDQAGAIIFEITRIDTLAMKATDSSNLQIQFEDSLGLTTILMEEAISIVEPYY